MKAEILYEEHWDEWEEFNLKYGNVFQSIGFAKVVRSAGAKIRILVVKDGTEIVAGLLYFKPLNRGLKSYFSELRVVSGPVLKEKSDKVLILLLNRLINVAHSEKTRALIIKTNFTKFKEIFASKGFKHSTTAPRFSFNVKLDKKEDELWKQLDKKTRNVIRKAQKEGVTIEKIDNKDDVKKVYELYICRVKERKNQVPIPYEYFLEIFENVSSKFLVAKYNDKIIAESIFLEYGEKLYYFNNGSLPEYWKLNANSLLIWEIMKKNAGSKKILNLYGTPSGENKEDPNYSMYKFKSGFGGKLVEEFEYYDMEISKFKQFVFNKILVNFVLPIYKRFM
jgi:lipid II:glycine glycyltransferase (peptidoglycan interpeptide bridge formation enzyme)